MSSVGRAASRGSKSGKGDHATNKTQKSDTKTEPAKTTENLKAQPTPEQMRIAQIIEPKNHEDPQQKEKIRQLMDATHKDEGECATALFDCDNDLNKAVEMLLEGQMSEWETSSNKKKKNRQPSTNSKPDAAAARGISSADVDSENWEDETPTKPSVPADSQQRTRSQRGGGSGGGPPRMRGRGAQDNRGWRGRENKENERNLEDGLGAGASSGGLAGDREQRDSFRRGAGGGNRGGRMSNGAGRGGGRGGSRTGPRSFGNRGGHDRGGSFPRPTSWNPDEDRAENKTNNFPSPEDWDNEEYTGSLSDTKVFTPSNVSSETTANDTIASLTVNSSSSDTSAVNSTNLNYAQSSSAGGSLSAAQTQYLRQLPDNKLPSSNTLSGAMSGLNSLTNSTEMKTATRGIAPSTPSSGITYNSYAASAANSASAPVSASYPSTYSSVSAVASSVSAAETNYTPPSSVNTNFNTYQSPQTQPASYSATATSYSTVYGSHQDGTAQPGNTQVLPQRTKTQRPRVPPPSKIPQSAVEMPGGSVNTLLDVQFGALELSEAFDSNSSDPQPSPQSTQVSQTQNQQSPMSKYSTSGNAGGIEASASSASQSSMDMDSFATAGQKAAQLTQQLKETLLQPPSQQQQSNNQSNDLKSQQGNYSQPSRGPGVGVVVPSPLDSLVKNESSSSGSGGNVASASGSGPSGSLSYSAPSSNYQPSYNSQKSVSGYQSSAAYNTSYSSQAVSGVSASPSNTYPTSYPSNVSSQAYQNVGAQSVYGGSGSNAVSGSSSSGSVVGSSSGYTTSSSGVAYQNSYGTSTASAAGSNKLTGVLNAAKDIPQYDTTATSSSNLSGPMTSSSSGAPGLSVPNVTGAVNNSAALTLPGSTSLPNANNSTSTKVTNSSAKSGVVQNMPPGVPPIIAGTQYIMSQGGLQFFQQPVYSYDEQQLLPLRIPHMTGGYYDISFQQAPTSLATGRDANLANVPYSMSDGRFARTDNASPVPSSLSQQNATQAHQQPMMNAASFPPGYGYTYYGGTVLPANYQYGTPAIYPQVAPATNAHGNSNTTQYPKPGSYGSSYGSGYEGLSASQDYSKGGGYAGGHTGGQTANKAGVGANAPSTGSSATDLYNKTHVALSKVNSYDKQGFHSGTPPPFNLAGNQNTGMAPSGAYPPPLFIPQMPHQQHHSTTLMQHPLHQQMDMRNTSRRSESGNNSGQRSQSSAQSNKPGSKQNYSQSYWNPN